MGSVTLGFFRVQGLGMGWGTLTFFFLGLGLGMGSATLCLFRGLEGLLRFRDYGGGFGILEVFYGLGFGCSVRVWRCSQEPSMLRVAACCFKKSPPASLQSSGLLVDLRF